MCEKCAAKGQLDFSAIGLGALQKCTQDLFPVGAREAWIVAQQWDVTSKHLLAAVLVIGCSGFAAAVGGNPVPFVDGFTTSGIQLVMLAKLAVMYNVPTLSPKKIFYMYTTKGVGLVTFLTSLVGDVLKIIPFAGTVTGVAVDVASNGLSTVCLGILAMVALTNVRLTLVQNVSAYAVSSEDAFNQEFARIAPLLRAADLWKLITSRPSSQTVLDIVAKILRSVSSDSPPAVELKGV